jgi:hypothetical protein
LAENLLFFARTAASFCKIVIPTFGFRQKRHFFAKYSPKIAKNRRKFAKIARKFAKIAENCQKSMKIVIITSTPDRHFARSALEVRFFLSRKDEKRCIFVAKFFVAKFFVAKFFCCEKMKKAVLQNLKRLNRRVRTLAKTWRGF